MNTVVISLGSNTGDLPLNISHARWMIGEFIGPVSSASHIYETDPWGNTDQPHFLNQVITVSASMSARDVLNKLLEIEIVMGRIRTEKWAPRLIDLDILYYNNEIIKEPGLNIPHPHLHERRFALVPLAEILPEMIHPVLNKSHSDLLTLLSDNLRVEEVSYEATHAIIPEH